MGRFGTMAPNMDDPESWEPTVVNDGPTELADIRTATEDLIREQQARGVTISGRILLACHTLPYTCSLVEDASASSEQPSTPPIEIRQGDMLVNPQPLHSPVAHVAGWTASRANSSDAIPTQRTLIGSSELSSKLSKHKPNGSISSPPPTPPASSVLTSPSLSLYTDVTSPNATIDAPTKLRWVLTPRRGHAALNAGIRSLGDRNVTLVASPGELYDANGDTLSYSDLSESQRADLEAGLSALSRSGSSVKGADKLSGIKCRPVWLEDDLAANFYEGYCKGYLWPVFHYHALSDHTDKASEAKAWGAFYEANARYARAIAAVYQPGDLIWIHDYHLLLVPKMLREMLPGASIGFFLHSPFPSSEFFRCLPRREAVLDGMLGANLCAFQTYSYGRHFFSSCVRVMGYEGVRGGVDAKGWITRVSHCPIGIDSERIDLDRRASGVKPKIDSLRSLYAGRKIIIGRDKLDPTKGVLPKLQAYERFLRDFPQWIGKVVLIQVTSPSPNDSPTLATKVSELVDHINGTYGSLHFQPALHYHQTIDRDEYFALLSVADLAMVNSIRDGMNTTSMEYVICQSETKNPIILSEYCGTTASMRQSSVCVNPWDLGETARAIDRCLSMSDEEKAQRHANLHQRVMAHTAAVWASDLVLKLLGSLVADPAAEDTQKLREGEVVQHFQGSEKRLFLFDYDGTLTPIVKNPSKALPSPKLLKALDTLASDPANAVYVISGRDSDFLDQHLGHIRGLGLSAEHGCFIRQPGADGWTNLTEQLDLSWQHDVEELFKYYEERTTGSWVEKKTASMVFHYRNADPVFGVFQAKECQTLLEDMQQKVPIDVLIGKKNVEVRPLHTHKGEIVKRLVYEHKEAEFILCAGDDKTDEDMFRALHEISQTSVNGAPPTIVKPMTVTDNRPPRHKGNWNVPSSPDALPAESSPPRMTSSNSASSIKSSTSAADASEGEPESTNLKPEAIYTLIVDSNAKRKSVAKWRVDEPENVVNLLADLAGTT